jgi:hypothetical protein
VISRKKNLPYTNACTEREAHIPVYSTYTNSSTASNLYIITPSQKKKKREDGKKKKPIPN